METINAKLIQEITAAINRLKELQIDGVHVETNQTPAGQFQIQIDSAEMAAIVEHGWGQKNWSFARPTIIQILLMDKVAKQSYAMYMSEADLQDFPNLLREAYIIITKFLQHNCKVVEQKRFIFFDSSYLHFDDPQLAYTDATRTKKYVGPVNT